MAARAGSTTTGPDKTAARAGSTTTGPDKTAARAGSTTTGPDKTGPGGASGSTTVIGGTLVTPMDPVAPTEAARKHNTDPGKEPEHEMIAAHRGAVRDAIRGFGFGGLTIMGTDREADLRELETKLAASTDDLERGTILYAMGQTERLRDNCSGAAKHWREAKKLILESSKGGIDTEQKQQRRNQAFRFFGRVVVAEGYCRLLNGRALGTDEQIFDGLGSLFGVNDAERAEAWFAIGIAKWETGDLRKGAEYVVMAARKGNEKLRQAAEAYVAAVGMKLSY
jgi:hypothetical protein